MFFGCVLYILIYDLQSKSGPLICPPIFQYFQLAVYYMFQVSTEIQSIFILYVIHYVASDFNGQKVDDVINKDFESESLISSREGDLQSNLVFNQTLDKGSTGRQSTCTDDPELAFPIGMSPADQSLNGS